MQKTKYFINKSHKFPILELSDPASFCFKKMRTLTAPVEVEDLDKIEATKDVAEESDVKTSSGQNSSTSDDEDYPETFEQIVQKEPKRGYKKYLKASRGLGGFRKKFNSYYLFLDV